MDSLRAFASVLCFTATLQSGHVQRVIDGDTFTLYHVGTPPEERVRVLAVDTPERGQPGYTEATVFTRQWLAKGPFDLVACKRDSFGRLLADISRDGVLLSDVLKANNFHTGEPR